MKRSIQISRHGGPEVFKLVEQESELILPGYVRIATGGCGVNFADLMMRMGLYPEAPKPPFVPGYEFAGTITEIGPDVTDLKVGDRVLAGTRFGGYTSEALIPAQFARKIPAGLTDIQAASIPVNFLTAWLILHEMGRVRPLDRVLIQSGAGGVGLAAIQIARNAGAEVIGVAGSESKFALMKEMGAKGAWLNHDWEEGEDDRLGMFDIILDPTGGESLKRSYRRLAPAGRVITYGVSSMVRGSKRSTFAALHTLLKSPLFPPLKLMNDNRGVFGFNLLKIFDHPRVTECLDEIMSEFEKGRLKTHVGATFPLAEAGQAHIALASRQTQGKVVLVP